ncbi:MAG TPA: TetR/AcrR family transcriptional regulator [Parvibaculum sp.]
MPKKAESRKGKAVRPKERPAGARRRLTPAVRRLQILEAAKDLFASGGIERVSMRNIAMRVGITQAAIYQHFEGKDAILFAVCEDFFARLIEANEKIACETNDPVELLKKSMLAYVETGLKWPEEYRLVFMTSISGLELRGAHRVVPGFEEISPTKGKIAFAYLHDQVRALIAGGHIRQGDVDVTAEAIWAASHGLVSLFITHVHFPWERQKIIETQMKILLLGLLPEDSPARAAATAKGGRPSD